MENLMKIVIASDHAGFDLKQEIAGYLKEKGHEVIDAGTTSAARCNYPDFAEKAAHIVAAGVADCGVLVCGTGAGMAIAAGKVKGIRVTACSEPVTARLIKEHNNANMIALGARIVGVETAKAIVDAYLGAEFAGGRHADRVAMITEMEERFS